MKNLRKKQIEEAKLIKKMKSIALFDELINKVEQENDRLVYHWMLTDNGILNLLYVSKYEEDWAEAERPCDDGNYIQAYTIDLNNNYFTEIRDIFLGSQNGYLIRTDDANFIKIIKL